MTDDKPRMTTLINRFTLHTDTDPADFEREFKKVGDHFSTQPGILGYTLSRALNDESSYVNVALWADPGSLRAAVTDDGFTHLVASLRELATSDGQIFSERIQFISDEIHIV